MEAAVLAWPACLVTCCCWLLSAIESRHPDVGDLVASRVGALEVGAVLGQLVHPDVDDLPAGREVNGLERGSAWPAHTDSRGARCLDQMLTNLPVLCLTGLSCSSTPRLHRRRANIPPSMRPSVPPPTNLPFGELNQLICTSAATDGRGFVVSLLNAGDTDPPSSFPLEVLDISGTARRREGGRSQPPPCDGPPPVKRGTGAREKGAASLLGGRRGTILAVSSSEPQPLRTHCAALQMCPGGGLFNAQRLEDVCHAYGVQMRPSSAPWSPVKDEFSSFFLVKLPGVRKA